MSDLHDLCKFSNRPITHKAVDDLKYYLKAGIPATYTIEEAYNYMNGIEEGGATTTTTPLHLIATHVPKDLSEEEMAIVNDMVTIFFEYGAGWCLTDVNNDTPGCIFINRGMKDTPLYNQIVDAGVRAELLLRKVSEFDMEVLSDEEALELAARQDEPGENATEEDTKEETETKEVAEAKEVNKGAENTELNDTNDPSFNQKAYLESKLQYKDDALVTEEGKDGVMMSWETDLMKLGSESLFKKAEDPKDTNILNIGFGMGIIDGMINAKNPTKHYICEAHPDVLEKMKADGWYSKPNVVILEGRWQELLNHLLSSGLVYFDGIYYDTFSEHYQDMLELFDFVVGLLKPTGVFSFFNGLGADRQVIYEVYKKLVEIDLGNYGLKTEFKEVKVPQETMKKGDAKDESVWDEIRRPYWLCPVYYHPEATFHDIQEIGRAHV